MKVSFVNMVPSESKIYCKYFHVPVEVIIKIFNFIPSYS